MASVVPSVFTVDGRPGSPALVINQDGMLNSPQNPAEAGSVVSAYATGLSNTVPPIATGTVPSAAAPLAFAPQTRVYGFEITYAGAAPGSPAGVAQINFRLPSGFQSTVASVQLTLMVTETSLLFPDLWIAESQPTYFFVKGSGTPASK